MIRRSKERELAMQVLYLWDMQGEADTALAGQVVADCDANAATAARAVEIAAAAWAMRDVTDAWLERLSPQWPPRRQPIVDHSILRLAIWEMTSTGTGPRVVLDEAIELAKKFSTENSPAFINGVLDAALREKQAVEPPAVVSKDGE